uniref:Uncharacterized protein n=1 Tax=Rhizophora mucronata TaxID=61149 RepID=A0A2P2P9G4_RHIMU
MAKTKMLSWTMKIQDMVACEMSAFKKEVTLAPIEEYCEEII